MALSSLRICSFYSAEPTPFTPPNPWFLHRLIRDFYTASQCRSSPETRRDLPSAPPSLSLPDLYLSLSLSLSHGRIQRGARGAKIGIRGATTRFGTPLLLLSSALYPYTVLEQILRLWHPFGTPLCKWLDPSLVSWLRWKTANGDLARNNRHVGIT